MIPLLVIFFFFFLQFSWIKTWGFVVFVTVVVAMEAPSRMMFITVDRRLIKIFGGIEE
jgi:hypothetical protein